MTTRHTISHADELYHGGVRYAPYSPDGRRGVLLSHVFVADLGAPDTADAAGILDGVTISTDTVQAYTAGDLALTVLDVARNIVIGSTDGTECDHVVTVTGTDVYGETLVENITANGTTTVQGNKAFYGLSSISVAAGGEETTLDVGFGNKIGLPVKLADSAYLMGVRADGIADDSATLVAASDTTATATTGDVRGTITPGVTPNDVKKFTAMIYMPDVSTKVAAFGQDQYAG